MLLASTARSLFSLEGDKHSLYPSKSQECDQFKSHVRKLLWVAYAIDKELCLRTGRPPTLPDDECDLDLLDVSCRYENGPKNLGLIGFFPTHLPLSMLQSHIYTELYSIKAQRKSETELLMSIRELDRGLEEWRNAISVAEHQVYNDITESEYRLKLHTRFELLQMQHRYCVIAVHQSVSRCRLHINEQNLKISMAGIDSSLQVAVNESRLLLENINTANTGFRFDRDTFWYVIQRGFIVHIPKLSALFVGMFSHNGTEL
ncbi:uncharacterized protein N7483_013213 [Penicillium malachiteum]|uniref:uncharacterized protein n=1 Tax=Penicillium malachiteum TaxID=1324776 RepID=UPI0025484723|nr:uncharacterized protein N7483_013213 [Penicillium malachiteum]KAJ5716032.1 hypothetical protein N7483_013213 [Penicillium malachiteum]